MLDQRLAAPPVAVPARERWPSLDTGGKTSFAG